MQIFFRFFCDFNEFGKKIQQLVFVQILFIMCFNVFLGVFAFLDALQFGA